MDTKLPASEKIDGGHIDAQHGYHSAPRAGKAGRRRKKPRESKRPLGQALARLILHLFPSFWDDIQKIDDPRDDPLYTMSQIISMGLLMFCCRIRSRRELDKLSDDACFHNNWCLFSGARTETVVCFRQMANVLAAIGPGPIAALSPRLLRTMLRNKQAPSLYLLGHVTMVADGTGIFSSRRFHCAKCLYQEHRDGAVTYLHNVLEIKAVGADGLALSVLTEAQLNPEDKKSYDKQDCEIKAFHRALPRLKKLFPREPIAHLLDSLYCQAPVFREIEEYGHKFICCFKRGSIPALYDEALELLRLHPENRAARTFTRDGKRVRQVHVWVPCLDHQGQRLDFILCEETVDGKTTTFAYLTNFNVTRDNVETIADGGRRRWVIENQGFNEQKTGYELEHFCGCKNLELMLCLYALLQIAHLFMQLLARSDLTDPVGHLTVPAMFLLESLRNTRISQQTFAQDRPRFQIRFAKAPT